MFHLALKLAHAGDVDRGANRANNVAVIVAVGRERGGVDRLPVHNLKRHHRPRERRGVMLDGLVAKQRRGADVLAI